MSGKNSRYMIFTIAGDDVRRTEEFMQAHALCADGLFGDRFEFTFYPSPHGMPKTVTCVCGQTLYLDPPLD